MVAEPMSSMMPPINEAELNPVPTVVIPEVRSMPTTPARPPVFLLHLPVQAPVSKNQTTNTVLEQPKKVKTSFLIIRENRVTPAVSRWSPYNGPIVFSNQPSQYHT